MYFRCMGVQPGGRSVAGPLFFLFMLPHFSLISVPVAFPARPRPSGGNMKLPRLVNLAWGGAVSRLTFPS